MPRTARATIGGIVYHVLNGGNNRQTIFHKPQDFDAFSELLIEGKRHAEIDIFAFCIMRNHWHLALRPKGDADLAQYLSWVTNTHVKRYRAHYPKTSGHLYQGRYKSFPVETDEHFLVMCRYVEANASHAGLVSDARAWRWSSACSDPGWDLSRLITTWPVDRPKHWPRMLNTPLQEKEVERLRTSIARGRPFGSDAWTVRVCKQFGLQYTLQRPGRPVKKQESQQT